MERPAYCKLRGERYRNSSNEWLAKFIQEQLFTLDYEETAAWYAETARRLSPSNGELALLGCNDRYFLLTVLLGRQDAEHPWLFNRCREVERDPDGYIDLWARFHYKSTIITFAGAIQEVMCDPEITIAIFSVIKPIAEAFLNQIKEEFEQNEKLKQVYPDVLYAFPRQNGSDGHPAKWGVARGITVKRKSNPKEATVEAHGLIDGQPTSRHFRLHIPGTPRLLLIIKAEDDQQRRGGRRSDGGFSDRGLCRCRLDGGFGGLALSLRHFGFS